MINTNGNRLYFKGYRGDGRKWSITIASLLVCFHLFGQSDSVSIKAATTAYNQFRLEESRAIFESIAGSASYPECDREEATYNLALQDWKIFRNYEASVRRLKSCLLLNCQKARTYILLGQIQLQYLHYSAAISFANKAIQASNNESDKLNSFLLKAQIIYEQNVALARRGVMLNIQNLLLASKELKLILAAQPGRPASAELLIGISLLLKNGPDVFYAWKSYFFITDNSQINRAQQTSYNSLNAILPVWNKRDLSKSERENLVQAIAASQFYDYAELLVETKLFGTSGLTEKPEIKRILQFEKYIRAVQQMDDIYYPRIASGLKNYDSSYEISMEQVARKLWVTMDPRNTEVNYNEDEFFNQIEKKYGAEGYMGTTVGYFSMLLGLVVHDELKEINQYGLKATFRYIAISRLISKDFTSWYGATNVGGWGTDSCIYQVRDAYLQEPFARLGWVTDSMAHGQIIKQIAEARKIDFITCRLDKYAEPSFLSLSIKLNASQELFDSLRKTGLSSNALYLAFISETLRLNVESTVFAHEGRHAIDQRYFKNEFDSMTQDERELRAKYSEIIFSSKPKLALTGSILGGDLDSNTIHGKANYRLRKIIADWMQLHSNEIGGLDNSIPLLMQLELLSDQQLREICISADPLSSKLKGPPVTGMAGQDLIHR
jgi:hypothetical protein